MEKLFDIVIPVGPNDHNVIQKMVANTKRFVVGYRNIYLVSYDPNIKIDECITVDEIVFPFDKDLLKYYFGDSPRIGWYLQQLIKLYAGVTIENILNNYLVIDSDTFFSKPTTFFENGVPLYNVSSEYHVPYFEHMKKLHPTLIKQNDYSGICHHMVFQTNLVSELFNLVNFYHHEEFYITFLKSVDENQILCSGASEYEIYFNYLHIYHSDKFKIRKLEWTNSSNINDSTNGNYDYISCHWYMR